MKQFTTSRGVAIEFLPIPRETMLRFRAAHPEPTPPTYAVTGINGVTEQHAHDETTVETPEEKAVLAQYREAQAAYTMRYLRFFVLRGVKVVGATMDEWQEEQAFLDIPVSANKAEARFEWLTDRVLSTPDDYKAVMLGVIAASGVPEELLTQIEATFQRRAPGNADSTSAASGGAVDGEPRLDRGKDDVSLPADALPVGETIGA